jgi:hypothetical protein
MLEKDYGELLNDENANPASLKKKFTRLSSELADELPLTQDDVDARKKRKVSVQRMAESYSFEHKAGRRNALSAVDKAALACHIDINNIATSNRADVKAIGKLAQTLTGKETIGTTTMYKYIHDMSRSGLISWNKADDISALRARQSTEAMLRKSFKDFDQILLNAKMLFLGPAQTLDCQVCDKTSTTFCLACTKVFCDKCSEYMHGMDDNKDHATTPLSNVRTNDDPIDEFIWSNADESWLAINNKQGGGHAGKCATAVGGSNNTHQQKRVVANSPLTIVASCHVSMKYDKEKKIFTFEELGAICPPMFINGHDKLVSIEEAKQVVKNGSILVSTPETARMNFLHMEVLARHYIESVQPTKQRRAVLFLDGVDTHLSLAAMNDLVAHYVTPYVFEPNLTHIFQPCDGTLLKVFKKEYKEQLLAIAQQTDEWSVSERTMVTTAIDAFNNIKPAHVAASWSARGIIPVKITQFELDVTRRNIIAKHSTASMNNPTENVADKLVSIARVASDARVDRMQETTKELVKLGADELERRKAESEKKKDKQRDEVVQLRGSILNATTLAEAMLIKQHHKFDAWKATDMIAVIKSKGIVAPQKLIKATMIPLLVAYEQANPQDILVQPPAPPKT